MEVITDYLLVKNILYSIAFSYYFILLFILIVLDVISGYSKAVAKSDLSSKKGNKGLLRNVWITVVLLMLGFFCKLFVVEYIYYSFTGYFILNTLISLLENLYLIGVPLPKNLISVLEAYSVEKEEEIENNIKITKESINTKRKY